MKVVVTTGPSYEPIDDVRRITNLSTGELGIRLARQLAAAGFEVFCLRSITATYPGSLDRCQHEPFATNQDLLDSLTRLSRQHQIAAFFHVAALCDFKVKQIQHPSGQLANSPKIESRTPSLTLQLEPAEKIIGQLRSLFPTATIVGWKYEIAGTPVDALAKAWRQIDETSTDACVLNGKAYGAGFALCTPPDQVKVLSDKTELVQFLPTWLTHQKMAPS